MIFIKRDTKLITVLSIAAAAVFGAAFGFFAGSSEEISHTAMEAASDISVAAEKLQKPRYLLSSHEGRLAVYMIGKKEPELVFDRYLHYLPDVDRMRLEEGIEVSDYAELLRLIEDYTS